MRYDVRDWEWFKRVMISVSDIKEYNLYYTKPEVAKKCHKAFQREMSSHFEAPLYLEPSAGSGSFLDCFSGDKVGYDIFPQREDIIKLDFLKKKIQTHRPKKEVVVMGNPPFGKRSKMAIDFFNQCAKYSNTIAFILPNQFRKYSVQNRLDKSFRLIYEMDLEPESFLANGKEYSVRCVFQIWTTLETSHENLRILKAPVISHKDFEIFQYNNTPEAKKYFDKEKYQWDFAVPRQGFYDYSKRIKDPSQLNEKVQWAFFKAKNKTILKRLEAMDFDSIAKRNTMILGFGKHDVIEEYRKLYG